MSTLTAFVDAAQSAAAAADWRHALAQYEQAFGCVQHEGDARTAAELLRSIGKLHWNRGDYELAADCFDVCVEVAEANRLPDTLAAALNCLAVVAQFRAGAAVADPLYRRALALARQVGDARLQAMISQNLGTQSAISGDLDEALLRYDEALDCYTKIGDDSACAWALNNIGMIQTDLEHYGKAASVFTSAMRFAERAGDARMIGLIQANEAEMFVGSGDYASAHAACDRAAGIFTRLEARAPLGEVHKLYGMLFRETRQELAESHFLKAIEIATECEDRLLEGEAESECALLYDQQGRRGEALQCLNRARHLFAGLKAAREVSSVDKRLDRVEEAFIRVVKSWGESIEAKDHYTAGHCERVAAYACMLARAVGLPQRELTWFQMGAFLHDVGKVALRQEILNKRGPLNSAEWDMMKQHTIVGAAMVSEMNFPWDIRPMVRHHHEHWDGTGYPDGLRGDAIPLAARMLCIADVYDALSSARSYKPALPRHEALEIMEIQAGSMLDPDLFRVFRNALDSSGEEVPTFVIRQSSSAA